MRKILICSFLASFVLLIVLAQVSYGEVPKPGAAEMLQKLKDINSVKPIDLSLAKKIIVAKKGIERPVLDLSKTAVDYSKTPPPPKEKKVPHIVSVMDFPKSQEIASKFKEISKYLSLASDKWRVAFTPPSWVWTGDYVWGAYSYKDENGKDQYGMETWWMCLALINWPGSGKIQQVESAFQDVIQDVMIAEACTTDVKRLLNDFERLPKLSAEEKPLSQWRSDIATNLDWITFLHGRCDWLYAEAGKYPFTDQARQTIYRVPGADIGADFKSMSDASESHVAFFRDYYTNHNLPH